MNKPIINSEEFQLIQTAIDYKSSGNMPHALDTLARWHGVGLRMSEKH